MREGAPDHGVREKFRQRVEEFGKNLPRLNFNGSNQERLKTMGALWKTFRFENGFSAVNLFTMTGYGIDDIKLFESGEKDPSEISETFLEDIAMAIGKPQILAFHNALFNPDSQSQERK